MAKILLIHGVNNQTKGRRVVKDEITPSHKGRQGRVVRIRDTPSRQIRVALLVGDLETELSYDADELERISE